MVSVMLFGLTGNAFGQYVWPGNVVEEWTPGVWEFPPQTSYCYLSGQALRYDDYSPISGIPVTVTLTTYTGTTYTQTYYTGQGGHYEVPIVNSPDAWGNIHVYFDGYPFYSSYQANIEYYGNNLTCNGYLWRID